MNINTKNLKLTLLSFFSLALFVVIGLVATNTPASAAPDTCVWTGGGTGDEDTNAMTWTFDVSDAANWSTCDNGGVPESGDTLEFPADLADIDPGDVIDDNDEYQWRYIVNNDLVAGTEFAGIQFTGSENQSGSYDDGYQLTGNGIQLSGDVTNEYDAWSRPEINLDVETVADAQLQVGFGSSSTVSYGTNTITLGGGTGSASFSATINGTGVLEIGQNSNFNPQPGSSIGNAVTVLEGGSLYANISQNELLNNESLTITAQVGATVDFNSSDRTVNEILTNVVFVGAGSTSGYSKGNGSGGYVSVEGYRGSFHGQNYDEETESWENFGLEMAGGLTLSADTVFRLGSDLEISGPIVGDFSLEILPGSRGSLTISSAENESATENGTIAAPRYNYSVVDSEFDFSIPSGADAMLDADEEITVKVFVQDNGRLMGSGVVAGLEVRSGGTVAPGESPGCIESDGDLTLNGTYEFEILNNTACTGYDQLDVTGEVDVTGATLDISLLPDYGFDEDDEFVLISNDGTDVVTGEFDGLAEGDEIEIDGNTFVISYEGGDGNDVSVLATAVSDDNPGSAGAGEGEDAPGAPDTGVGSLLQNPLVTLSAVVLTGAMIIGQRKLNSAK
jgi:hypothetical protein